MITRKLLPSVCIAFLFLASQVFATEGTDNGFVSSAPGSRYGASEHSATSGYPIIHKFTAPGSGTLTITKIGVWAKATSGSANFKLAIFTDDAANTCPETLVTNSDSGTISVSSSTYAAVEHTYGSAVEVTGGSSYWIGLLPQTSTTLKWSYSSATRTGLWLGWVGDWPSGASWHSHTDYNGYDTQLYAVYTGGAAPAGQAHVIRINMD